jgi:2-polyprenyl-3-methyl-5-hydroxy-6-metoxy-1,4-benzoquinol methylase
MPFIGSIANRKRMKFVVREISKDMRILDLGCGDGSYVNELRREGYDIVGIDPNLPSSAEGDYLFRRSAYESGFEDSMFDAIVCLETIEHLEPKVYDEIRRIAKEGCKLIVTTPKKRWNWLVELLSKLGLADPLTTPHINLVSPEDLPFALMKSGSFMFVEWWGVYRVSKK